MKVHETLYTRMLIAEYHSGCSRHDSCRLFQTFLSQLTEEEASPMRLR